jgi:hypothetical protein
MDGELAARKATVLLRCSGIPRIPQRRVSGFQAAESMALKFSPLKLKLSSPTRVGQPAAASYCKEPESKGLSKILGLPFASTMLHLRDNPQQLAARLSILCFDMLPRSLTQA